MDNSIPDKFNTFITKLNKKLSSIITSEIYEQKQHKYQKEIFGRKQIH